MAAGSFITLEGGEGCGKSTQARLLARHLMDTHSLDVVTTREPGGPPFAEKIRNLILSERPEVPETEFLLFAAARAEHVGAFISPALKNGRWVVCDRFIDSTRIYQGELAGIDTDLIHLLEKFTVAPTMPDLTLILDLPVEISMARAKSRGDLSRYDAVTATQHQRLRDAFLNLATSEPSRCVVIDADGSQAEVAERILDVVRQRLLQKVE